MDIRGSANSYGGPKTMQALLLFLFNKHFEGFVIGNSLVVDNVVQFISEFRDEVVHDGVVLDIDGGIEDGLGLRQLVGLKDVDVFYQTMFQIVSVQRPVHDAFDFEVLHNGGHEFSNFEQKERIDFVHVAVK